jgi:benzoyl-CoA reductase/2-hydroxyglutaryl-CoA dehydratase subunit BcrC/BadD/HgdB
MPNNITNRLQQVTEQNLIGIEKAKASGRSAIGFYCLYSPTEMALAEQYLSTPCSVMSPNTGRLELLKEMIREFSVDGVIDLTWQACHTYNIEAFFINEFIQETFGIPTLHLETDYTESDTEQLRVRIQAYLEML